MDSQLHFTISSFLELLFPQLCVTCDKRLIAQERYLCMDCWLDLPVTHFHNDPDNKVAQLFWGRISIENATSWFSLKRGSRYLQLIHYIKYKGFKALGTEAGRRYGMHLNMSEAFCKVDIVVPVPLHRRKLKRRGYNQSELIAMGIAEVLNVPVSSGNLYRKKHSSTQTQKSRFERWKNVEENFGVCDQEEFSGKHVLLIDDVVTTGSTLESCALELLKSENAKVSIATLAFADF